MLRFEVTNGSSEFACRVKGKIQRFHAGGLIEISNPSAELVEKVSCAHFAGVGVVVHEGLLESAVESDEESLKLVYAFEKKQLDRIAELRKQLAKEEDSEKADAIRAELGEIRLVHPVEVGE